MNKKGFSTVELLVSFVIVSFVAIAMFNSVLDLLDKMEHYQALSRMTVFNGNIVNSIQKDLNQKKLYGYSLCGCNCYDITYQDLTVRRLKVDNIANTLQYGGITERLGEDSFVYGNLQISKTTLSVPTDKNDTIFKIYIPIYNQMENFYNDIKVVYQYDSRNIGTLPPYVDNGVDPASLTCAVPVNKPILAPGMTAIKWNSSTSTWIDVNKPYSDTSWYDYANKEWANARTADGSMWVWIPRYIYNITTGWHNSTAGTIAVKFSLGTDDTIGGTVNLANTDTANDSNGTWTSHPAFTFGTTQLTGIWVAKFEPSGTTAAIDIKPNVTSLRSLTIGDMFTAVRNMETNARYGWDTTGFNIDTHLMKNVEWGATAYLAQSVYGKNSEIWLNNSNTSTTGCAGDNATDVQFAGCEYAYNTTNGKNASTTGTIYGVYDMSGGSWEYVAAYVDNGDSSLTTNGNSIISADNKYKDIYTKNTIDDQTNNYLLTTNKKGDALYETSSSSSGTLSWNSDYSNMPSATNPWFERSGRYGHTTQAGTYCFYYYTGASYSNISFRPVILTGANL